MISRFKAAIFDMDGTLLESMRFWRFAALEYIISQNLPMSENVLTGVFHRSARKTVEIAYVEAGLSINDIPSDLGNKILEFVTAHYERSVLPKPGALEYVRKLHDLGIKCCVATATQKNVAEKVLSKLGFSEYIDFVFDTEDAGCSKAYTAYFEAVSERLGLPLSDCVMFEDAHYSIKTAKEVGLRVIAVEDVCAVANRNEIIELADKYIKDFRDLL